MVTVTEVIVKYSSPAEGFFSQLGQNVSVNYAEDLGQGFALADIPEESLPVLYSLPFVEDAEIPKRVYIDAVSGLDSACIRRLQDENTFGLTGKGVIVGIIDTGVDYSHPEFRRENGETRILYFWDQGAQGSPPEGFVSGAEYSSGMLDAALLSGDPFSVTGIPDRDGHGTAVAGIAAGNTGSAPGADIIAVKVRPGGDDFSRSAELMRGIKYITDKARLLQMPAAINISYGMNEGSHRGDSLFEEYLTAAAGVWKLSLVVPTGNEGGAGHHYSGMMTASSRSDISFFTAAGLTGFYLSLWKDFADDLRVGLILPGGERTPVLDSGAEVSRFGYGDIYVTVIYGQPTRYSISQEVFFDIRAREGFIPAGLWKLVVVSGNIANGRFDVWLPTVAEVTTGTYFADPDNYATLTIPSTSGKVIRAAGYNDRIGSAAEFSGVGWNAEGLAKPDVTAPCVGITAPRAGGGYGSFTGTSFAAPFATGAAALLMEQGIVRGRSPFLYGEKLKAYLHRSAVRIQGAGYPSPVYGYGRLCAALEEQGVIL